MFIKHYFYFMFWFFGHDLCVILVPHPGIEPTALYWKVKSYLTTGPTGKSLNSFFLSCTYEDS